MPKRFKTYVKEYIAKNYKDLFCLIIPIFIRRNVRGGFDYFDPVEKKGGGAGSLKKLQDHLREAYTCSNCGGYHVIGVVDLTDPARPVRFGFGEFLNMSEEEYYQKTKEVKP
jgi:hypothetical protein